MPNDKKQDKKRAGSDVNPKRRRRNRTILWTSIGVGVLACVGVGYAALNRPKTSAFKDPAPTTVVVPPAERHRVTVLLVGTDTRPGQTGGLTDVLIVLSVDYKHKRIEMLSIPRDTKVQLPSGSYGKINELYDLGGISLTDSTIESIAGIDIPNYAITHFGGLVDIINTIGGIYVNVPERMNYDTGDKQYGIINLYPGYQKLTGEQALGFVRFREDALGDIGRTMRQQAFLKALENALFQPSNITKLPKLIPEFWNTVDTDFSLGDVLRIASGANQLKGFKIVSETLPGAFHNPAYVGDASYWIVNDKQAQWAAKQLFYKGIVQPNVIQTEQQVENWTPPSNANSTSTNSSSGTVNGAGTNGG